MSLPLIQLRMVDSTQSFLARHPELGLCGVMAAHQNAGRGRGGNRWESPDGAGLWLSARVSMPALPPGLVLQRAMSAVIAVLPPCGVELGLKWPNDLVARKEGRLFKVGGILGEAKGGQLLLGIGLNLFSAPSLANASFPPASLRDLGAMELPELQVLAAKILDSWTSMDAQQEPTFRWPTSGEALQWEGGRGLCLGWEADGRLRVATNWGIEFLSSAEIRALGPDQNR